jgi:hypothetical protein
MFDEKTIKTAYQITLLMYKLHIRLCDLFQKEFYEYKNEPKIQNHRKQSVLNNPFDDPF